MAAVTRASDASVDTSTAQLAPQIPDLIAGEALAVCAPCYISTVDGLVYQSNGAAANAAAKFDGITARAVRVGEPVTLFGVGTRFRLANGTLTPGSDLFLGTTAGNFDTAATTGGTVAIARTINTTDARVIRNAA